MTRYRTNLPQLSGDFFLTDGGLETTLIFHEGHDLPYVSAFVLFKDEAGRAALRGYFEKHVGIARDLGVGFIMDTPTWRSNPDWAEKLGYGREQLAEVNRQAVAMADELRKKYETAATKIVLSAVVGPRGDGYDPAAIMTEEEAERYHAEQIGVFAETNADMVSAITMTNIPEAIGIARAATDAGLPVVISFTVETDGKLPTGDSLKNAVEAVDAATAAAPAYYMINCAHPTHFENALANNEAWLQRLRGLRANASAKSHAELDESTELDAGNPEELGGQYRALRDKLPQLVVFGGCCGTDHRHIAAIGQSCATARRAA